MVMLTEVCQYITQLIRTLEADGPATECSSFSGDSATESSVLAEDAAAGFSETIADEGTSLS